ncbi:MAG: major facilitator superfamily aromatic acid/H+ symporter [Caballeronia sp.]|uniref:MFS transporter n=1 Tax=Caballeronia sp. TaxID=1931223 RepID=UPI002603155B|nr:MFS transporter [Caballeronia sp.]MDB5835551.1 major facilitator superfamily aromatic acid/H+ symporter [Caballeronia sp.]
MASHLIDVAEVIERQKVGRGQCLVVLLCALLMFLDGFDTQAVSYIVPALAKDWHLPREILGSIFSVALVGLMIGYLAIAPLSARFGHKRMMLASSVLFAVFTLLTVFATNVSELIGLRFLTGIGLGAAAPSAVALTCEFAPKRLRATFVLLVYCGFSLGFVVAGLTAGALMPTHGWKSLMLVGAIAPLVLTVPLAWLLPESLAFLQRRPQGKERMRVILLRLYPRLEVPVGSTFRLEGQGETRASVVALVKGRTSAGTLLLWLIFFLNLAEFYFMQSWLPTMLTGLQYSAATVVWVTALPTIAGVLSAVPLGLAMDRVGPYVTLTVMYLAGCVFMWLVGDAFSGSVAWLMLMVFCAGFCISGGQKSVIALAAVYYPINLRSTGVGWALGIGRLGGIAGPLIAGMLYSAHWTPAEIFRFSAWPVLVAGIGVFVMGRIYGSRPVAVEVGATH